MAQKHIEGDVVMYGNQIMVIKEQRGRSYFDLLWYKRVVYSNIDIEDIKPVPLTHEILEKNGWEKDKEKYVNDSYHLYLCGKYDGYSVYKVVNDNVVWLTGVRNVSDLQHLLFGLGLKQEMEVQVWKQ